MLYIQQTSPLSQAHKSQPLMTPVTFHWRSEGSDVVLNGLFTDNARLCEKYQNLKSKISDARFFQKLSEIFPLKVSVFPAP